jgi:hypothetical protein
MSFQKKIKNITKEAVYFTGKIKHDLMTNKCTIDRPERVIFKETCLGVGKKEAHEMPLCFSHSESFLSERWTLHFLLSSLIQIFTEYLTADSKHGFGPRGS